MASMHKRNFYPITDWNLFLREGREEFLTLLKYKGSTAYNKEHFELIRTIGKGGFGLVYLAKLRKKNDPSDGQYFALKLMSKDMLVRRKHVKHAKIEKKILLALNFPFCVYLEHSFQDMNYVYLSLPFIAGGDMFHYLKVVHKFDEGLARFYAAQVLLALEYMHFCDHIFRDLKPENVLIDAKGYLKITDFGFCKYVKDVTYTFCGTPHYIAPEIIRHKGYGKPADWWTFGVLVYEMVSGYPPFNDRETVKIYEKATSGRYAIPPFFSDDLKDFVTNILQVDVTKRYGNLKNGILDIKEHRWLKHMNYLGILNGEVQPPYVPPLAGAGDLRHFKTFEPFSTLLESNTERYQDLFKDF